MTLIETKKLRSALEQLWPVVPKKGTLPVLENVRWRLKDGKINLVANDLENVMGVSISRADEKHGETLDLLIPAETLLQAVKSESSSHLETGVRDGKFELRAGGRVLVLPCQDPQNFPKTPDISATAAAFLLASGLRGALGKTMFCLASDQSRYSLDAVKLETQNSKPKTRSSASWQPMVTASRSPKVRPSRVLRRKCRLSSHARRRSSWLGSSP